MSFDLAKIIGAHQVDNLSWQKWLKHERVLEAREKSMEATEEIEEGYFQDQAEKAGESLKSTEPDFKKYILQEQAIHANEASFDPDVISKFLASYVDDSEIDAMFSYMEKQNLSRDKA